LSATALRISARRSGVKSPVISVSTNPGAITFAVIDLDPYSRAMDRAIPTRPALVAA
jgi:hypothetical protein